jgi:D-glycero-D-manno-heptose 1,7-bisphosphate phosphatase
MTHYQNWAVFLDRDGTINEEVNYLSEPDQLKLIPGAIEAITMLNQDRIPVIVVTNQAGIARGYFTEERLDLIHKTLNQILISVGARIDDFYYCPHHPTAGKGDYLLNCNCRKPQPGMLIEAAKKWQLDLSQCYLIGDKSSDIMAGKKAGCHTILVRSGYGKEQLADWKEKELPDRVSENLLSAVEMFIIRR